jgi:hypothetical protein
MLNAKVGETNSYTNVLTTKAAEAKVRLETKVLVSEVDVLFYLC